MRVLVLFLSVQGLFAQAVSPNCRDLPFHLQSLEWQSLDAVLKALGNPTDVNERILRYEYNECEFDLILSEGGVMLPPVYFRARSPHPGVSLFGADSGRPPIEEQVARLKADARRWTGEQAKRYLGEWRNVDSATRRTSRLEIYETDGKVIVQGWGACKPRECNMGQAEASSYSEGLSVTLGSVWITKAFRLVLEDDNRLKGILVSEYHDNSGRARAVDTLYFVQK